jgi:hypothetical protein
MSFLLTTLFLLCALLQPHPVAAFGLKEKASIGIAVPFGVIIILIICGFVYANKAKEGKNGEVVELGKVEEGNGAAPAPAPAQKNIKWSPYG